MKRTCGVALALLVSWAGAAWSADDADPCINQAAIAEMIMQARQLGMPMTEVMAYFPEGDLGRVMVRDAYSFSRYHNDRVRQIAIEQFRDSWAAACYDVEAE